LNKKLYNWQTPDFNQQLGHGATRHIGQVLLTSNKRAVKSSAGSPVRFNGFR